MFYFIHIPKTAGTSLVQGVQRALPRQAVATFYGKARSSSDIRDEIASWTAAQREDLVFVAGHQVWYGIHELFEDDDPQYITFLRSPISRVVSDYYKIRRNPRNEYHDLIHSQDVSLATFVALRVSPLIVNHMTVFIGRDDVDRDHNASMCTESNPELLERSVSRLRDFAYIGMKSSYAQDLQAVGRLMGVTIPEERANVPEQSAELLSEVTPALLLEILKLNTMDAVLYDYATILRERGAGFAPALPRQMAAVYSLNT